MSRIQTKFDNTLKQSEIIINLTNSSEEEMGKYYQDNKQEIQQTSVYGIQAPLIMVNNIVIDFIDILSFNLRCDDILPSISVEVRDRKNLISTFNTPGIDNELRVQILPKFDDKYKKINLTFYITSMNIDENIISIIGDYKLPDLTSDRLKSFGEIDTYNLFETIAKDIGLGFATNTKSNDNKRYIYCANESYENLLNREINYSNEDDQILDYWIDPWNNLTLVDIYERYNATDKDEEMMLWVTGENREVEEGNKSTPMEVPAILNNHISSKTSELYVEKYNITNSPGQQMYSGTDRLYSIYEEDLKEYKDYMIQDGSVKKDIFTKFEYMGEVYGKTNYLISRCKRNDFLQKIQSNETVNITLNYPLLGLLRGNRVNFVWYINDDMTKGLHDSLKDFDMVKNKPIQDSQISNLQNGGTFETDDGGFILDNSISGQYYINGWVLKFENKKWEHILNLSRSTLNKPEIIDTKNET